MACSCVANKFVTVSLCCNNGTIFGNAASPTRLDDMEFLARVLSQDLSSVPDPGIGDWFNGIAKAISPPRNLRVL